MPRVYDSTAPQGAMRDTESGGLVFPVNPREKEKLKKQKELEDKSKKTQDELEKELKEVKSLKDELLELKKELKGE